MIMLLFADAFSFPSEKTLVIPERKERIAHETETHKNLVSEKMER